MQRSGEQRHASILIVDDRPANLVALDATLEPLGQRVVRARSGEEALVLLETEDFACILLDVQMPGLDGWETASLIKSRERTRHLPILFLTAMLREEAHIVRGYSAGAVDYIVKPYEPEILRAKVKVFVDLHLQARDQKRLSERLRASEDALRDSEGRLRLALEASHMGTWRVDLRTDRETRDANLNRIFGLAAEETVHPRGDFLRYLHPEDRERVKHLAEQFTREPGARDIRDTYRLKRPDGAVRWVRLRGQVVPGDDGRPRYVTGAVVDITDLRRAEEEREELLAREKAARAQAEAERQRLERLFRAAPALVNIHRGPEHVFELVHPLTYKLLGQRELVGKPVREAIPELEGQGFFELLDRVYQTGEPAYETAKPARVDRSGTGELEDVFFDFTYQPTFDAQGRVEGIMTFAVDVTEQVNARCQAEALAAEAERLARQVEEERGRLEAVLQQMPQGVIIAEAPSGRLLLGNRQVERIWRRPFFPSADIEQYIAYQGFHPDGRPYAPHEWPLARAITAGEVVQDEVIGLRRGDGTRGVMEVSASPVRDEQGRVTAGVVVFNDITERKAATDTAAFLAQASSTLASSLDYTATLSTTARLAVPTLCDWCMVDLEQPDGTFHRVAVAYEDPSLAPLAERARRFPPAAEGARGYPPTLVALRKVSVLVEEVDEAWLEKAALNEAHYHQMKAIGFKSIMSVPLVTRGRALGVLTFLAIAPGRRFTRADLEIAEELARRAALAVDNARLYEEAQQAVRLRDEFLSVASHELKTPLTPLALKLQVLAREAEAQGGSAFAQRVLAHLEVGRRQVKKLSELIGDLLDVSRISAGRMRLELEPVDLVSLVGEVTSRFEPEAGRAGCKLVLHTHGALCGNWDRLRLEQSVSNLLSNALKYGAGRPIHIHVEAAGDKARLRVRDEGIGIEPQAQERIFEKFERAVSERNYGGLGLGLFITRQIVEALGGHIQVTSVLGQGATFTVELPLVSPPHPDAR